MMVIYALVVIGGVIILMTAVEIFITLTPGPEVKAANKKIKEIREWLKHSQK